MASNRRDELGPLPSRISALLTPTVSAGPRAAIKANLGIAEAVMLVVPDANAAARFPAMDWIVRGTRSLGLPMLICDGETNVQRAVTWASSVRAARTELRMLVTGPRATRWSDGETMARRLICGLGLLT
jgi:hypothetical protein